MKQAGKKWLIFLLPVGIVIVFPLLLLLVWSVAARYAYPNLLPQTYTLRGLAAVMGRDALWDTLRSVGLSLCSSLLATVAAFMAARVCALQQFPLKKLYTALMLLPVLLPLAAYSMGIQVVFLRVGLGDHFWGLVLAHSILVLPYAFYILLNTMQAIGNRLEEQAIVLGATKVQALRHIFLPQVLPSLTTSLALGFTVSFSQYFITLLVGGGQVQTLTMRMAPFLQSGDRTMAAAYAVVFLFSTAAVCLAAAFIQRHYYRKARLVV